MLSETLSVTCWREQSSTPDLTHILSVSSFDCEFNWSTQHFNLLVQRRSVTDETKTSDCLYDSQKALMWDRWQKGESMHDIARLFDRHHPSIRRILTENAGIRPRHRKRSSLALTLAEREVISRGLAIQLSMREIASQLGRSPSTVSREIQRNGGYASYRASAADEAAWQRALRPKSCKLAGQPRAVRVITKKLQCEWSPQQIAGWLKRQRPQ